MCMNHPLGCMGLWGCAWAILWGAWGFGVHMGHILWDAGDFGGVHGPSSVGFRGLRGWHGPSSVGHGGLQGRYSRDWQSEESKDLHPTGSGNLFSLDDISFGKIKEMKRST